MSETGYQPELSEDERAEHLRRTEITFAMLPATRYPRLVEGAAAMASYAAPPGDFVMP